MIFQEYKLHNFSKIIRQDDTQEKNHGQNLFAAEANNKQDLIDRERIISNTSNINYATEGIAYHMLSDNITVYNTSGGSIPTEKMDQNQKQMFSNADCGNWRTDKDSKGNPDFICFDSREEEMNMFFVEVKADYDQLTPDQKRWINLNKWAETYLLEIKKTSELDENNFVGPQDLKSFSDTKDLSPKDILID